MAQIPGGTVARLTWQVTNEKGRSVFINKANVTYIDDVQTFRRIHFTGPAEDLVKTKDSLESLVMDFNRAD